MVYSPRWGSRYSTILLKYFSQAVQTLWLLARRRPRVVFVMAPPVAACLPVWFYCLLARASFVIDAHTGALLDKRWARLQWLQRFLCRRAVATIVTNAYLQELVEEGGARATIVTDVPLYFANPESMPLRGKHNMVLVSSFDRDEATVELLEAATGVPEVEFYVTGDHANLPCELLQRAPANVHFTGYLQDGQYVGLVQQCDAVLALTTQDHTMQRAAYEAIYLGTPVITSDFGLLREAFPKGTIHVRPTAVEIAKGIREMLQRCDELRREASQLREEKLRQWEAVAAKLRRLVGLSRPANTPHATLVEAANTD